MGRVMEEFLAAPRFQSQSRSETAGTCKNLWLLMLAILMSSFKASALLEFEATFDRMTTLSKKLGLKTLPQADIGSRSLADPFAQFILQQTNAILGNQNNAGTCSTSWNVPSSPFRG
jgi:hypothetical protein